MKKRKISIGKYSASVFSPADCVNCPVVYTHFPDGGAEAVAALQGNAKFVLVSVEGIDWDRDLPPWPASRVFRSRDDFAGGRTPI